MEEIRPFIIPTLSKAKISRQLSYPIGAEHLTKALISAAQLPVLKLHFYAQFVHGAQKGQYEFLRVEYLNKLRAEPKWPVFHLYNRPPQWRWEIVVQPVPRTRRHAIKKYIFDSALPQIEQWLAGRAQLAQEGNDLLAFFYDDKDDEFTTHRLSHLEPLRV